MAEKNEIYKCDVCGNVAYMLEGGDGDRVCCGQDMRTLTEDEMRHYEHQIPKPGSP